MREEFKKIVEEMTKTEITISTLEKLLDAKVAIAKDVWGDCSMGHKQAVMARRMLDEIRKYLSVNDIDGVTFERIHHEMELIDNDVDA